MFILDCNRIFYRKKQSPHKQSIIMYQLNQLLLLNMQPFSTNRIYIKGVEAALGSVDEN